MNMKASMGINTSSQTSTNTGTNTGTSTAHTIRYYQEQIDQTIQSLGGYWRPLSGLARLIEEIGEVHELLLKQTDSEEWKQELANELTDLYVISTCLAHQYCADLEEEYTQLECPVQPEEIYKSLSPFSSSVEGLMQLTSQSGQIARILNHYEGDKKKKPTEKHRSIAAEVAHLHILLLRFSNTVQVRLFDYIEKTLTRNLARDKNRFDITHDPITESSRIHFIELLTSEGNITTHKIWGARPWLTDGRSVEENVLSSLPTIERWLKCGEAESIEGVVFELDFDAKGEECTGLKQEIEALLKKYIGSHAKLTIEIFAPKENELLKQENKKTFFYVKRSV